MGRFTVTGRKVEFDNGLKAAHARSHAPRPAEPRSAPPPGALKLAPRRARFGGPCVRVVRGGHVAAIGLWTTLGKLSARMESDVWLAEGAALFLLLWVSVCGWPPFEDLAQVRGPVRVSLIQMLEESSMRRCSAGEAMRGPDDANVDICRAATRPRQPPSHELAWAHQLRQPL